MFKYDEAILEKFPNVVGGIIIANGMSNQPSNDDLQTAYHNEPGIRKDRGYPSQ